MRVEYDVGMYQYFTGYNRLTKQEAKWLKDHGSIIYGADNNSPPLRYVDHESRQYEGLVVDYLRALSIEIGADIEFEPHIWNDALKELEEGRTDICDMYPSEKRGGKYLFSDPIYYQRGVVLVKSSEDKIKSYIELSGEKVAAQEGDYAVEFLNQRIS